MKTILSLAIAASAFVSSASAMAGSLTYTCRGDVNLETISVEVLNQLQIVINDEELAQVDNAYAKKNPKKKTVRLLGSFKVFGHGVDGYNVTVTASKTLLTGSQVGYLNTYNDGPEGYYEESYKCVR